jgi:hypothetical protein
VDELPEEGITPRLVDSYWAKGVAILVCHNDSTKAWESSKLKLVGLDALPPYRKVAAWFPGPVEDTQQYFCGFIG